MSEISLKTVGALCSAERGWSPMLDDSFRWQSAQGETVELTVSHAGISVYAFRDAKDSCAEVALITQSPCWPDVLTGVVRAALASLRAPSPAKSIAAHAAQKPAPKYEYETVTPVQQPVLNLMPINEMLKHASGHLKRPAISFGGASPLKFKRCGSKSKYAGLVGITNGATDYAQSIWYGYLTTDGVAVLSYHATDAVREALAVIAADPISAAAHAGKKTGACSFCSRPLSTEESLAVGYGPVCAEHFGLPWGEQPKAEVA